jgi:hypothetical protein
LSKSSGSRAIYGKAIGSGLAGLAGLAAQGLLASDAQAESAPIRVMTSESKHKDWFDLSLAYPENPNGVHIAAGGDFDADGFPDIVVGNPVGSGDSLTVLADDKDRVIKKWPAAPGNGIGGMVIDVCKIPAPPAPTPVAGIVTGAASGPSSFIKLSSWDRSPSSPLVVQDEQNAFPGQTMRSGVHVAAGDLDGDGRPEIVAGSSGDVGEPGALPASSYIKFGTVEGEAATGFHIKFEPEFYPYGQSYRGGVRVATGDVNGDGVEDIVTVGSNGSKSKIDSFTWKNRTPELFGSFEVDTPAGGDVSIAIGDVTGDGVPDVCVSKYKERKDWIDIFSWNAPNNLTTGGGSVGGEITWTLVNSISVYGGSTYDGGFNMVIQDVTGDGIGDIIAAPAGVVPEPASLALLSVSAMCLRRRRRRPPQ